MDPTPTTSIKPMALAEQNLRAIIVNFPHTEKCGLHKLALQQTATKGKPATRRLRVACLTCAATSDLPGVGSYFRAWNYFAEVEPSGPTLDADTHQPVPPEQPE